VEAAAAAAPTNVLLVIRSLAEQYMMAMKHEL